MRRKGITLIETMIAVSASSLLLLLSINVLHQTLRLSSKAKSRTDFHQSNMRLAACFREDVHNASNTALSEDGSLILTLSGSGAIVYRQESDASSLVIREVKTSNSEIHQQDVFRMLDSATCKFQIIEKPNQVAMKVDCNIPGEVDLQRMEMRVLATPNRWSQVASKLGATR